MRQKQSTLLFLVLALCISCRGKTDREALRNARNYLTEYDTTFELHNEKTLEKGYAELRKNSDFEENGITVENYDVVYPLFAELKKYDELEKLLLRSPSIPDRFNNEISLNYVRYLKNYYSDKSLAKNYIKNNVMLIQRQIYKTPQDSTLYPTYFVMKAFLNGQEEALKEIDSMQNVNKNYSDFYYKYVLKQGVEERDDHYSQP